MYSMFFFMILKLAEVRDCNDSMRRVVVILLINAFTSLGQLLRFFYHYTFPWGGHLIVNILILIYYNHAFSGGSPLPLTAYGHGCMSPPKFREGGTE